MIAALIAIALMVAVVVFACRNSNNSATTQAAPTVAASEGETAAPPSESAVSQSTRSTIATSPTKPGRSGTSAATTTPAQAGGRPAVPLAGVRFYVDPDTSVAKQVQEWKSSRPADAALLQRRIGSQPQAKGFSGWEGTRTTFFVNQYVSAANAKNRMPVLIAYNMVNRDLGGYSGGGAKTPAEYRAWIRKFAAGIGNRKAVVILEPDALVHITSLKPADKEVRYQLLTDAVDVLAKLPHTLVYIDAGNILGPKPPELAARLKRVGVDKVQGFSLNVANYQATEVLRPYAEAVSKLAGGAHWVIDSGRNGLGAGPDKEAYCNVRGRGLGHPPTGSTGIPKLDAYLWVIHPGESDGTCNGDPEPGNYIGEYGLELIRLSPFK